MKGSKRVLNAERFSMKAKVRAPSAVHFGMLETRKFNLESFGSGERSRKSHSISPCSSLRQKIVLAEGFVSEVGAEKAGSREE